MDPDSNWYQAVSMAHEVLQDESLSDEERLDKASYVCELVAELNTWMVKGGFPPKPAY